jgi:hypothetical protein
MTKLLYRIALGFALLTGSLWAQNVRYDAPFPSISSSTIVPLLVANVPPNSPVLAVCHSPANALPCTNYATTYTSTGSACPNGAQDTPQPQPSACQPTGDGQGNIGFWAPVGTYDYTVCVSNNCYGPYTVTLGTLGLAGPTLKVNGTLNGDQALLNLIAGSNITLADNGVGGVTITSTGGAGGGSPGGSNTQIQYNNFGSFGALTNQTPGYQFVSDGTSSVPIFQVKPVADVRDFAAAGSITRAQVGDGQVATDCWMTSGSAVLTCTGNHFAAGDVGKQIVVDGAGATTGGFVQPLQTTIASYTSATQVTLTATASNSNTQAICNIAASPTGASMNAVGVVTITCGANHNFAAGQDVVIIGIRDYRFNSPKNPDGTYGTVRIASTPTATTFTFQSPWRLFSGTATSGSGTANGNSERVVWGTDNTATIQAAVDSLASTSNQVIGGGTVLFPANVLGTAPTIYLTKQIALPCSRVGTFSTGTCTKSYNNISLEGPSRDEVVVESFHLGLDCGAGACSTIFLGQQAGVPFSEGGPDAGNVRLSNITIHGITFRQIQYATSIGDKVIRDFASDNVNIYDSAFLNNAYECIVQAGGFASRNWHVHDNNFGACGRGGPATSSTTSAINMNGSWSEAYNNYATNSGQGIESAGHHMVFKNNWMYGTNVEEGPLDCINLGSSGAGLWDIVIEGNVCQDWGSGLTMGNQTGTADRFVISNNTFRNAGPQVSGGGESNTVTYPQIELDTVIHGNSVFTGNTVISDYYSATGEYGVVIGTAGKPQLSQEHWTLSKNTFSSSYNFSGQAGSFLVFQAASPGGWTPSTSCTST